MQSVKEFSFLCLLVGVAGMFVSSAGLLEHNELYSIFGFVIFAGAFFVLFGGLYRGTPNAGDFWLERFLRSVGRFRLLSKIPGIGFDVESYVEGSLLFSLFINALFHLSEYLSGAGSYMYTSLTSAAWYFLLEALIMSSLARYSLAFRKIRDVEVLCADSERDEFLRFFDNANKYMSGRLSGMVFLIGAIVSVIVFNFLNGLDKLYSNLNFYVPKAYNGTLFNVFVLEPPDVMGLASWYVVTAIVTGLLAVGALMAVVTLQFLTHLSSESTTSLMSLSPYNPIPLDRVSDALTSFWIMTSSGLLILPLLAVIATTLGGVGRVHLEEVNFLTVYYYPIFLASIFIMSATLVKRFISRLKMKTLEKIYKDLRGNEHDAEKVKELTSKLSLVRALPEGPVGSIFMQLFEVLVTVGTVLLNLRTK